MSERRIAIFGTQAIQTDRPQYSGQRPAHEEIGPRGRAVRTYSLGKFERAHRLGYDIYVVTMLPELEECHRWWRSLIPGSQVFVTDGLLGKFSPGELAAIILEPWKRLYAALGFPWDPAITDVDAAKRLLVERHGVIDGAALPGYATS